MRTWYTVGWGTLDVEKNDMLAANYLPTNVGQPNKLYQIIQSLTMIQHTWGIWTVLEHPNWLADCIIVIERYSVIYWCVCSCCALWTESSHFQWRALWHVSSLALRCCCRLHWCGIEMLQLHWNWLTNWCLLLSWSNVGASLNIGLAAIIPFIVYAASERIIVIVSSAV